MTMLQALATGHCGSMSSIHANSCRDALRRLEVMCLMGMEIPLTAVRGLIGSAVDVLIHLKRDSSGRRMLTEICELELFDGTDYRVNPLFQMTDGSAGPVAARKEPVLKRVGRLENCTNMEAYGQMEMYLRAMEDFDQECQPAVDVEDSSGGGGPPSGS